MKQSLEEYIQSVKVEMVEKPEGSIVFVHDLWLIVFN